MSRKQRKEAIITKSLDGRIKSWSRSAETMFGYTASQAVGRHISIIIPFDYQDEEYEILDRLKNGGGIETLVTVRRCREGKLLRVKVAATPVADGAGKIIAIRNVFWLIGEEALFQKDKIA